MRSRRSPSVRFTVARPRAPSRARRSARNALGRGPPLANSWQRAFKHAQPQTHRVYFGRFFLPSLANSPSRTVMKAPAARPAPMNSKALYPRQFMKEPPFMAFVVSRAMDTAGLSEPPDTDPIAYPPTTMQKPMARP